MGGTFNHTQVIDVEDVHDADDAENWSLDDSSSSYNNRIIFDDADVGCRTVDNEGLYADLNEIFTS